MQSTTEFAGITITRRIQSTFHLQTHNASVWIDPIRLTEAQVGNDKADLILVTHPHRDHFDPKAITACRKEDTWVIASSAAAEKLAPFGIQATALWEGETWTAAGIEVTAVPGYNGLHPRAKRFNVGFRFKLGDAVVYHSGDTDAVPELAETGPVDLAFLPIGGVFVMDEAEAARAVAMVAPRMVIPTHYGFATGGDPRRFAELVGQAAQVAILDPVLPAKIAPAPLQWLIARIVGNKRKRW